MKDNFSSGSDQYAKFRPGYPPAFFAYLQTVLAHKDNAWDCGTGNGQVAVELAKFFGQVEATDISQSQLEQAAPAANITYTVQPAEQTVFPGRYFDLVMIAQAIHWFDFDRFYTEVKRVAKENALIVVIGYGLLQVSPAVDPLISKFYKEVIGPYWDQERKYIDEQYQTIPFPFEEIETPVFSNHYTWTSEHLIGYLNTWSAVKHFIQKNGFNPVDQLEGPLRAQWGADREKEVAFPMLLRVGKIGS